jgi:hypothetical protein
MKNDGITITLQLTGDTLDAIFGRELTDWERHHLTDEKFSNWMAGCESIKAPILETLMAQLEDIDYDVPTDDNGEPLEGHQLLKPKCDLAHADQFDLLNDVEGEVSIKPKEWLENCPSVRKAKALEDFKAENKKMIDEATKDIKHASWSEVSLKDCLRLIKKHELDGHTLRTLESWGEDAKYVAHLAKVVRDTNFLMNDQKFVDSAYLYNHEFPDGTTATLRINKPRVMVADGSVVSQMAWAHKISYHSTMGRGSGCRNAIEAIETAVIAMDELPVCEDVGRIIGRMAGVIKNKA